MKKLLVIIFIISALLLGKWLSFHFVNIVVINGGREKTDNAALKIRVNIERTDPIDRNKKSTMELIKIIKIGTIKSQQMVEKFLFLGPGGMQIEYGDTSGMEFHVSNERRVFLSNPVRPFTSIIIPAGVHGYPNKICNGFLWNFRNCVAK